MLHRIREQGSCIHRIRTRKRGVETFSKVYDGKETLETYGCRRLSVKFSRVSPLETARFWLRSPSGPDGRPAALGSVHGHWRGSPREKLSQSRVSGTEISAIRGLFGGYEPGCSTTDRSATCPDGGNHEAASTATRPIFENFEAMNRRIPGSELGKYGHESRPLKRLSKSYRKVLDRGTSRPVYSEPRPPVVTKSLRPVSSVYRRTQMPRKGTPAKDFPPAYNAVVGRMLLPGSPLAHLVTSADNNGR